MLINSSNLNTLFTGFSAAFQRGLDSAASQYKKIAVVVPSHTTMEKYGWLGQFPGVREWIGPRVIKNLAIHDYAIRNKPFESTVSVPRTDIEDDTIGIYGPIMQELGRAAGDHPDQLIFSLLKAGFENECFDGQPFFDTDHPVGHLGGDHPVESVSNMQAGSGPAWFLLDTSRAIKPLIYQRRIDYQLTALASDSDANVFFQDEFIYGTRGRSNAGYGLWQVAFASEAELNADNYEAARLAMSEIKGDEGRPLDVKPDTLVVPPALHGPAMRLLNNGMRVVMVGETPVALNNEWQGTAEVISTAWLA